MKTAPRSEESRTDWTSKSRAKEKPYTSALLLDIPPLLLAGIQLDGKMMQHIWTEKPQEHVSIASKDHEEGPCRA